MAPKTKQKKKPTNQKATTNKATKNNKTMKNVKKKITNAQIEKLIKEEKETPILAEIFICMMDNFRKQIMEEYEQEDN